MASLAEASRPLTAPGRPTKQELAIDALAVGGVGLASLLVFALRGRVPFTSDQGIISLMALDILERGRHPVFCYGSDYAGTLEAHLLAVAFGLFDATPAVFRITMGVLAVLTIVTVWGIARFAFGRRAALSAGLYMALGPSYIQFKLLTSDGGYSSLALSCALAMLAFLVADARVRAGRPALLPFAGFGFFAGVAWWILPLSAALVGACALAWLLAGRRSLSIRVLATAAVAAATGAFPWLYKNALSGWPSLRAPEMGLVTSTGLLENMRELARIGWPTLVGSWHVWRPGSPPLSASGLAILLFALVTVFALRRAIRERREGGRLALVLLLGMALIPSALSVLARRSDYVEPRYLLLSYLGLAPLCGLILDSTWNRTGRRIALLLAFFALGPVNQWTAPPLERWDQAEFGAAPADVAKRLRDLGIRRAYASYWIAYRVTFLSRGAVVLSPFGNGTHGAVRAQELAEAVDRDPDPPFLLYGDDLADFESYVRAQAIPLEAIDVGNLRLFTRLPPGLVERLRAVRSVPFSVRPMDVEWGAPTGPPAISTGSTAEWEIPLSLRRERPLPPTVHLSYHWKRRDGTMVVHDGVRSALPASPKGAQIRLRGRAKVLANVPPGDYELRFDLVHEGWYWFEHLGIPTPTVDVRVTDPRPVRRPPLPVPASEASR